QYVIGWSGVARSSTARVRDPGRAPGPADATHEGPESIPDLRSIRPLPTVGVPLAVGRVLHDGAGRRAVAPADVPPRAAELCEGVLLDLPADLHAAGAGVPRRVVFAAIFLSATDHRSGGGGRLGG